jgi:hypothetical protein
MIAPPLEFMSPSDREKMIIRIDQPFSTWQIWRVFDTAEECNSAMAKMNSDVNQLKDSEKKEDQTKFMLRSYAICFASDDPRMKLTACDIQKKP